ncbi:MAG: O-methyltransferase [Flavobacteriales bacterium]|nr:O-methyltransferase [Bacteroidota bacterium]MCB9241275.1 O-methyltransferase [Flavobacteriales bacterium]
MDFLDPKLSDYSEQLTSPETDLLARLNRDTYANVLIPRMLSGHMQGRILSMFSKMTRPKTIVEVGTYTGYSALCLAEGLQPGGRLITMDINEELETRIRRYFDESPYAGQMELIIGNALEILPGIEGEIDLAFIDADKETYAAYYDIIMDKMPSGGIIIADNVLWSGKVLDAGEIERDEETRALYEFSKKVHNDDRVENILMPVRDGLMIARKK